MICKLWFCAGEHVDFLWEGGHNIVKVNQDVYDDCSDLEAKSVNTQPEAGPFKFTAPRSQGTHYFVCGVGGHCEFGNQKAKIVVDRSC